MKPLASALVPLLAILLSLQAMILLAGMGGVAVVDIVRAYASGESYYSKGQKDAAYALRTYVFSGDPADYSRFLDFLSVPLEDGRARRLLEQGGSVPEIEAALIAGRNHPEDVRSMIWLFRTFGSTWLFEAPLETWREGDFLVDRLALLGGEIHALTPAGGRLPSQSRTEMLTRLDELNAALSGLSYRFAAQMGERARTVETLIWYGMTLLTLLLAAIGCGAGRRTYRRLKRAEDENLERTERIRDIVETTSDWLWETDEKHRFTYISERLESITGVPVSHFLNRSRSDMADGSNSAEWRSHQEALEARQPFRNYEYTFVDTAGRRHYFRISGKPQFDEQGRFLGYRGAGTDATAEVTARQEAETRQRILQATFDHMADGITVVDAQHRLIAFNQTWAQSLKVPSELLPHEACYYDVARYLAARGDFGDGDVEEIVAELVRAPDNRTRHVVECSAPGGRVLEMRQTFAPDGAMITSYTDITERKGIEAALTRARDEAEKASRSKNAFLANMSHELRTPLNAVIGFSQIIEQGLLGPISARYAAYGGDINRSGRYLLNIIEDLLDLSSVEAQGISLRETVIDLRETAASALVMLGPMAADAGIRIDNMVAPDIGMFADDKRVRQILVNLLTNAVKYSNPGGVVRIEAGCGSGDLALRVVDEGVGIGAEDIELVFDPFRQANAQIASAKGGVGLGLPLVRRLAQLHGGNVAIASEPGKGTAVTVYFPRGRITSPGTEGRGPGDEAGSGKAALAGHFRNA